MRSIDQANSKLKSSHQKYGKNMKLTPPCRDISWQEVSNKVMQPFIYPSLPMHFSPLFISSLVTLSQIHSASTAVWKQNFFWFTSFFCRPPWTSLDKPARLTILPICQIRYKDTRTPSIVKGNKSLNLVWFKLGSQWWAILKHFPQSRYILISHWSREK